MEDKIKEIVALRVKMDAAIAEKDSHETARNHHENEVRKCTAEISRWCEAYYEALRTFGRSL